MKEKLTRLYLVPHEMKEKLYKSLDGYEEKVVENLNIETEINIPTRTTQPRTESTTRKRREFQETLDSYPNLLTGK